MTLRLPAVMICHRIGVGIVWALLSAVLAGCGGSEPLVTADAGPRAPLSGRGIDAGSKSLVSGAPVFVAGTSFQTTTGDDGTFRMAGVPVGGYAVGAFLPGYNPMTKTLVHGPQQSRNIQLVLSVGRASGTDENSAPSASSDSVGPGGAADVLPATARRLDTLQRRTQ